MTLNPQDFMLNTGKRVDFSNEDKAILRLYSAWGKEIASDMADHFYAYLGGDSEMNAMLNANEGRIHRLHETFIHSCVWLQRVQVLYKSKTVSSTEGRVD